MGYGKVYFLIQKSLSTYITNIIRPNSFIIDFPSNHYYLENCGLLTMTETTQIKKQDVIELNKLEFIMTPGAWNKNIFLQSGIKIPLYDINPFFDSFFDYQSFTEKNNFTLGTIFNPESKDRKNIDLLIESFLEINDPNIFLNIKTTLPLEIKHPNIKIITSIYNQEELKAWYKNIDCYISVSSGEGLGFCLLEAIACGRTIISHNFSAPSDYLNNENCIFLNHTLKKATGFFKDKGYCAEIDKKNIKDKIKFAASIKNKLIFNGKKIATDIKKYYLNTNEIKLILKKHGLYL